MNLGLFSIVGYIHLIFAGRVVRFCHRQQTFSYHWSNIYFHQVLLGGQAKHGQYLRRTLWFRTEIYYLLAPQFFFGLFS